MLRAWMLIESGLSRYCGRLAHLGGRRQAIQGGHHAAFVVRYTRQAQSHFDSAQSSREHEVIETAEMANPKSFAGELAQPRPKRHIEVFEDDFAQPIRVVAFGSKHSSHGIGILERLLADDLESPSAHGGACGFAMAGVATKDIWQTLLVKHFECLAQAEKKVRGRRIWEKACLILLEHVLPIPIGSRQFRSFIGSEGLLGNRVKAETRRHH